MKCYKAINWWWIRETTGNKRNHLLDWIWCWLQKKNLVFIEFPLYGTFSVTIDYFTFLHVIFENFMGIWWKYIWTLLTDFVLVLMRFFRCQIQGDFFELQVQELIVIRCEYYSLHYCVLTVYNWNGEFLFLNCMLLQGDTQVIGFDGENWWFTWLMICCQVTFCLM